MFQNKVGIIREMSNRRKEQVVITRLRTGHSKVNGKQPTSQCDVMNVKRLGGNSQSHFCVMQEIYTRKARVET